MISNVTEEVPTQIAKNIAVVDNLTVIWCPHPGEPPRISAYSLYFRKLESMG